MVFSARPFEIAERLLARARRDLADWPEEAFTVHQLQVEQGPGVILMVKTRNANVIEVASGFGELGVPAERLTRTSTARMKGYVEASAFAGPYLADQLNLPFVLAVSSFITTKLLTAIDIARRFTGRRFELERQPGGEHLFTGT